MRTFWLTARIAAVFALLLAFTLLATFHLFGKVLGRDVVSELITLRSDQGVLVAEQMERMLEDHELTDPEMREFVHDRASELDIQIAVIDEEGEPVYGSCGGRPCRRAKRWARGLGSDPDDPSRTTARERGRAERVDAAEGDPDRAATGRRGRNPRGRMREVGGGPAFELTLPVTHGGQTVATLAMTRPEDDPGNSQRAFRWGLLRIGAVGLLGVILVSLYLTAPLRRMGRSMDRITAGELDHRAPARGRDEVAHVGRSFNAMADRIQTVIRGQKELMAGVSHELRSPLGRMKLNLELLREAGGDPKRVDAMGREVDALDEMVAELLVASRLDLGSATLRPEPLAMPALVDEAWERVRAPAESAGIELALELADDAIDVAVDRGLTIRLLGNLFENAVRHGGVGPVVLRGERIEERVRISVRDAGPGVDPDQLPHLFDPFYRADPSRSRKTGGTGLGLMIVRRAVEAHGGTVQALCPDPGGLEIRFDLPVPGLDG